MVSYVTLILSCLATIVLLAAADPRSVVKRMVKAEPGEITEFPYLVFIGDDQFVCNGVIVSKIHLLTAAHCVSSNNLSRLVVRSGSKFKDEGGSVHHIERVKKHENFYVTDGGIISSDDIAVVEVVEPFVYDSTTQPIELYESHWKINAGEVADISGYGQMGNEEWPKQLRKLKVLITDLDKCNQTYWSEGYMKKGQFCARSSDRASYACFGDSGGPLVIGDRLAGISIYGGPCELPDTDEVYTEVAYYRDWIDKYVAYDKSNDRARPAVRYL